MPEETKESKAKKLAAARKKLKEFQKRGTNQTASATNSELLAQEQTAVTSASSVSSNISEASDTEFNANGHVAASVQENVVISAATAIPAVAAQSVSTKVAPVLTNYFGAAASDEFTAMAIPQQEPNLENSGALQNLNAIQVLIAEKASLTNELNKYRNMCREKDLEMEELRTQYASTTQRVEELQQRCLTQTQSAEQLRNTNAELQHKLAQANAASEDQQAHLEELKKLLEVMQSRATDLEHQYKETCNELEMSQLRVRQLSDEANVSKDNRVESLTQTQFMYEQQIRDLQAMVAQLSYDKEQANTQYQNYVQHLNAEVNTLNERNAELLDENVKLQERERQLVEHVGGLEREIQKNISRQDQLKAEKKQEAISNDTAVMSQELEKLKEKLSDFELERHEFQLKIKSQEDRLLGLNAEFEAKEQELQLIKEHLENVSAEQPDQTRLLATMESDKVAASRALMQNMELKKQLDELELRFVQLTNDKADLMTKLDSEEFTNREMRNNYYVIEERMRSSDERFKFKDEEMIRLSHENVELTRKNLILQQQIDRLQHYQAKEYKDKYATKNEDSENNSQEAEHDHDHAHEHKHEHAHEHTHDHNHEHAHDRNCEQAHDHPDECHEAQENGNETHDGVTHDHRAAHQNKHEQHATQQRHDNMPHMPTAEAVEKLQRRFTQLMSQVADLTDEKQRLEHLVMQLQSETETIGEYIALYQTQRRILKQREYEKAAQMQLLQAEREQMRDKINALNNLVSSLGAELPQSARLKEHLSAALAEGAATNNGATTPPSEGPMNAGDDNAQAQQKQLLAEMALNEKLNSAESKHILTKIQNIITEIKENAKEVPTLPVQTVDHLNCCLGKFEVV